MVELCEIGQLLRTDLGRNFELACGCLVDDRLVHLLVILVERRIFSQKNGVALVCGRLVT